MRSPHRSGRLTIRTVLLVGFGLTLALSVFSSYYFARRMTQVQEEAEAINERYTHAQTLLSTIRTQVLLGAIDIRDVLLDSGQRSALEYRRHLETTLETLDATLRQYKPVLDSEAERAPIAQLRRQVADFRQTILEVLSSDTGAPREARQLLRNRIIPKREGAIRVSQDVEALNRDSFGRRQAAISEMYRATQRRTWVQMGLALGASIVIGLVATQRVGTLETDLIEQRRRDSETSRNLQRLSSQLVTVQEDERRTIARELHDEVGQILTAIKMELAVAQRKIEGGGGSPVVLADARSVTEQAIHTVRDLSHLLHPATLDDLGLPAAVETLVREFRRRHNIATDFAHERMAVRLPQAVEVTAYRIIQEGLTNVAKHAHAKSCRVAVRRQDDAVLIVIEDDGVGFDAASLSSPGVRTGLGLLGMRERVSQLHGRIQFESTPDRGSRIVVRLPSSGLSAAPGAVGVMGKAVGVHFG